MSSNAWASSLGQVSQRLEPIERRGLAKRVVPCHEQVHMHVHDNHTTQGITHKKYKILVASEYHKWSSGLIRHGTLVDALSASTMPLLMTQFGTVYNRRSMSTSHKHTHAHPKHKGFDTLGQAAPHANRGWPSELASIANIHFHHAPLQYCRNTTNMIGRGVARMTSRCVASCTRGEGPHPPHEYLLNHLPKVPFLDVAAP